tara:strand:- start:190 stop:1164 length:975 start_codon:yes stop_codon:yes gene_type:complete
MIGLDIGTMNIVCSTKDPSSGEISTRRIRDAFLDLPISAKRMLKMGSSNFIQRDDLLYIIGDQALEVANIFGREARRPLSQGLISNSESESLDILAFIIQSLIGNGNGENCFYSIPAKPIDNPSKDVIYHKRVFERIIAECGYKPCASNEAMAIVFSEASETQFSAISFSFGSGMTNVAISLNGIECLTFSIQVGGDWIDKGASQALGMTQARACSIKEKGIDLMNPRGREQEAIAFYYRELIEYTLEQTHNELKSRAQKFSLSRPIPIIVSGGTSTAVNFDLFFQSVFERLSDKFPFNVSEIKKAKDPFNSVSLGLLIQSLQE